MMFRYGYLDGRALVAVVDYRMRQERRGGCRGRIVTPWQECLLPDPHSAAVVRRDVEGDPARRRVGDDPKETDRLGNSGRNARAESGVRRGQQT